MSAQGTLQIINTEIIILGHRDLPGQAHSDWPNPLQPSDKQSREPDECKLCRRTTPDQVLCSTSFSADKDKPNVLFVACRFLVRERLTPRPLNASRVGYVCGLQEYLYGSNNLSSFGCHKTAASEILRL